MKIALFLKDENMTKLNTQSLRVLVFTFEDGIVIGMEEHKLYSRNINYISIWLLNRQVDTIYIHKAGSDVIGFFSRMNISVKSYDDIKDNQFLKGFLL